MAALHEFSLEDLPGIWFGVAELPNVDDVERELHAEITPGHVLDGVRFEIVAIRRLLKDVVGWLPDTQQWSWTHLTWTQEADPRWPSTDVYDSWEAMLADHR